MPKTWIDYVDFTIRTVERKTYSIHVSLVFRMDRVSGRKYRPFVRSVRIFQKKAVHLSEILRKQGFSVRYEVAFGGLIVDNAFMNPHTAIENAALSDVNIVFAGTGAAIESEGYDRKHMKLSDVQEHAILDTAAVNSNTVVVLFAGAPIDMSSWIDEVAAVVWAGFPGEKGDEAVADIFTGKAKSDRKTFGNVPAVLR